MRSDNRPILVTDRRERLEPEELSDRELAEAKTTDDGYFQRLQAERAKRASSKAGYEVVVEPDGRDNLVPTDLADFDVDIEFVRSILELASNFWPTQTTQALKALGRIVLVAEDLRDERNALLR